MIEAGPWTMACPVCGIDMLTEEIKLKGPSIVIDHCPACGGIWLDKGELNRMLRSRVPERLINGRGGLAKWGKQVCPRCQGKMEIKFIMDIELDECTKCKGIWLDHGELEALEEKHLASFGEPRASELFRKLKTRVKKAL